MLSRTTARSLDHRLIVDVPVLGDLGGVDLQDLHARLQKGVGWGGGEFEVGAGEAEQHTTSGRRGPGGQAVPGNQASEAALHMRLAPAPCPPPIQLACSLGSGISILRSSRPGRMSAGSSTSGRLVAATSLTCGREDAVKRHTGIKCIQLGACPCL